VLDPCHCRCRYSPGRRRSARGRATREQDHSGTGQRPEQIGRPSVRNPSQKRRAAASRSPTSAVGSAGRRLERPAFGWISVRDAARTADWPLSRTRPGGTADWLGVGCPGRDVGGPEVAVSLAGRFDVFQPLGNQSIWRQSFENDAALLC
jgi:hypothetical protein